MKKFHLLLKMAVLVLPFTQAVAQTQTTVDRLDNYFNEAYSQYPGLPKGILESMAYSASHMNNLQPHTGEDHTKCMGMPERFGLFGFIEDGKGYFKNNLVEVSKLSNITPAQFKNDVRLQILSTAKFLSREASSRKVAGAGAESFARVLESISEIPEDGSTVNSYARSLYTYDVYDNMQRGFRSPTVRRAAVKVDMEKIYPVKTLRALRASGIQVDYGNDRVVSPDNAVEQNISVDAISVLSADYGPAIWSAAHANNFGIGRGGAAVTNVVVHTAQGSYAGTIAWFKYSGAMASSHYVIRSSDGQITQMVLEADKAYHISIHNDYTIGIEHEGYTSDANWYTDSMYVASAALVRNICTKYNISKDACFNGPATSAPNPQPATVRIKGHQHYEGSTYGDPGIYWNWTKYAALINPATVATATTVAFTVRDQETGFAVPNAAITVTGPDGATSQIKTDANGLLSFGAAKGKYAFAFTAGGYKSIGTSFEGGQETTIYADIIMDPVNNQRASATATVTAAAGEVVLTGYVRNAFTSQPLAGVNVTSTTKSTVTDARGYFTLVIAKGIYQVPELPGAYTVKFSKTGYKDYTIANVRAYPDVYTVRVAMTPGTGARVADGAPATTEDVENTIHGMFDRTAADEQQRNQEYQRIAAREAAEPAAVNALAAVTVPTSIRVGLSCSCTTCSSVSVMSLEAYVQAGLDNEWIASWKAASLEAGAVAYRSYGAWYVRNPVKSNYDIATTTCNQAWGSGTVTATVNAAKATAGIVLVKNGAIFRSEYSSENNNSGCGNGYSGTGTSNGWPCISDTRCSGRASYGHGRGMCQYGSSFWASDKTYSWILDHYYTPGGVSVQGVTPPAATTVTLTTKNMSTAAVIASAAVKVTAPDGTASSYTTDASGKATIGINNGRYNVTVTASGYKAITTYFTGGANTTVTADVNLDPTTGLAARSAEKSVVTPNTVVLNGYVRDAASSAPLAGVQVTAGMYAGTTGNDGYFSFSIPAAAALTEGKVPEAVTIRSAKAGYGAYSIKNFRLIPDAYTFQIALAAGAAENGRTIQPAEAAEISHHGMFDRTTADVQSDNSTAREVTASVGALAAATVPGSIRIVTNCACATCATPQIQIMSLESYVATGVDNEWYASWAAPSLQAAAVAYRSRGAWYVNNPVGGNYDLSSAACHQTWGREMSASVKTATTATAGVVLVQNGVIVNADYAAETNNTGCGDGYSGTSATWPCITDERCLGKVSKGLGKGMCQWGSSYWATDKTYTWILDHYYTPAGIAIQAAGATLATAKEGDKNEQIIIGGSDKLTLYPNPVSDDLLRIGYKSDAAQSAVITIADFSGRLIQQQPVRLLKGTNSLTVSTSKLKNGNYIVTVRLSSGKSDSKKLVVAK
jgi:peptidoglycan hydrolase-like amidase/N-acetyl-anhydromuramyl-L-alanine amidase AmpD